jgi:phage baseplate assembly protein W
MANGITYGINFTFRDSRRGDFLELTEYESQEIKSDLIHLILTRKGSRYFLPDFGTRLYEYIFEPFDGLTFSAIETDIRDSVGKYLPNLILNSISVEPISEEDEVPVGTSERVGQTQLYDIYRVPGKGTSDYTAKVRIDYTIGDATFAQGDFIIINI